MTTARPTAWPARLVPPPRGSTGTPWSFRGLDDGDDVLFATGQDDAYGLDLVHARVRAVEDAAHLVEAHLAGDASSQLLDQLLGVGLGHADGHPASSACRSPEALLRKSRASIGGAAAVVMIVMMMAIPYRS